jgi:hypothetical protein
MRRHRRRELGLTAEEWVEISGDEPDFAATVARDTDLTNYVSRMLDLHRQLAEQTLRDAGLPTSIPDALYLDEDKISPNAVLARRILSAINESPLHLQHAGGPRAFIAGLELARWERQLSMNLAYERLVRRGEKQLQVLPNKPTVTDQQVRDASKRFKTRAEQAEHLGISTRQVRTRLSKLK